MTEEYEQALFLSYRLDPANVRFLRARLKNMPPYPMKELERIRRRHISLSGKIYFLARQTKQISDEVARLGVHCPWCLHEHYSFEGPGVFEWDLLKKQWGEGVECIDGLDAFSKSTRVNNEYRQRPDEKEALKVWNSFVVAAGSAPEVMIRERGRGREFLAAFRDSRNRIVPLRYEFIRQRKATKPAISGA